MIGKIVMQYKDLWFLNDEDGTRRYFKGEDFDSPGTPVIGMMVEFHPRSHRNSW